MKKPYAGRVAALDALYAELPTIECRGQCWDSCGPLPLPPIEQRRIAAAGVGVPDGRSGPRLPSVCPALTMFNQCSVYAVRPMICRLWGLVDNLPCEFGCVPDGGRLSVAEGYEFLARAFDIAGEPATAAEIRKPFATPDLAAAATEVSLAMVAADREAYEVREARARADGSAMYAIGRGRLSRTPPRKREATR